jgi:thiamine-phosphate pyrophosphorylase
MKLHALVTDLETARRAAAGGATIVQLRCKGACTADLVARGRTMLHLGPELVINDDVEAAIALHVTVHLGQSDRGWERAREAGIGFGLSVSTPAEAAEAQRLGARYVGAGPIWTTPSKLDTVPAIGLAGLQEICRAVSIPVVAIGGVDATNAADCIRAGAVGVAVIRGVAEIEALRAAIDGVL